MLIKNDFLPKTMDGLGEKGLKHENRYVSATGDHCNPAVVRALENDVQHHLVVPRVLMMLMMYPFNNSAMDFHVAVERDTAHLKNGIPNVGSTIRIQMSGMKNAQGASVTGLQLFVTKVLSVPNVPKKALVDIERARAHGVVSEERRVWQITNNVLSGLREEFIAVFFNLVAESKRFAARGRGEVFAG